MARAGSRRPGARVSCVGVCLCPTARNCNLRIENHPQCSECAVRLCAMELQSWAADSHAPTVRMPVPLHAHMTGEASAALCVLLCMHQLLSSGGSLVELCRRPAQLSCSEGEKQQSKLRKGRQRRRDAASRRETRTRWPMLLRLLGWITACPTRRDRHSSEGSATGSRFNDEQGSGSGRMQWSHNAALAPPSMHRLVKPPRLGAAEPAQRWVENRSGSKD